MSEHKANTSEEMLDVIKAIIGGKRIEAKLRLKNGAKFYQTETRLPNFAQSFYRVKRVPREFYIYRDNNTGILFTTRLSNNMETIKAREVLEEE